MRQRWGAVLPVAVVLFGAVDTSAQFNLGGLANINPQQIASDLSNKSPKDIASSVISSEQPKKIAEAVADATPAKAAEALSTDASKHVQKAAETITEAKKTATGALQKSGLSDVTQAIAGGAAAEAGTAAAVPAATPPAVQKLPVAAAKEESAPSSPQKASVVDALQSVSNALQHAGEALNGTRGGAVHGALNGTKPAIVVDAIKGLEHAEQAVSKANLEQAGKAAKEAATAAIGNKETDALKKAGQGLVNAFLPNNQVHEAVKESHPEAAGKAAQWLQDTLRKTNVEQIRNTIKENSPKVAEAIKKGDPHSAFHPGHRGSASNQVIPADGADAGMGLLPMLLIVCLVGAGIAGGWHLFSSSCKGRDVRSPTLLADAEMATWSRSAGQQSRSMQAEEPLFRQF